jgi:hypothetical protein
MGGSDTASMAPMVDGYDPKVLPEQMESARPVEPRSGAEAV